MNFNELVGELLKNPMVIEMGRKFENSLALSGLILRKPKFIKHDVKGIESCSFILYQIENQTINLSIKSYSCMVFDKDLVEQMKTIKNVLMVACVGKARYSIKLNGIYASVSEMETLCEFDLPLIEEWGKGKDDNKKTN